MYICVYIKFRNKVLLSMPVYEAMRQVPSQAILCISKSKRNFSLSPHPEKRQLKLHK